MTRIGFAVFLAVLACPAAAQEVPSSFPLGKAFKGVSISGFDVQKSGITLTVTRDQTNRRVMAAGSAGCNNYTATFMFRDDAQFDVSDVVSTKRFCGKPRMTTEDAFLTTLRTAHRWRIDDKNRLVLEGEAGRLLLTAGATAGDKKPGKKSENNKPNPRQQAGR